MLQTVLGPWRHSLLVWKTKHFRYAHAWRFSRGHTGLWISELVVTPYRHSFDFLARAELTPKLTTWEGALKLFLPSSRHNFSVFFSNWLFNSLQQGYKFASTWKNKWPISSERPEPNFPVNLKFQFLTKLKISVVELESLYRSKYFKFAISV